MRCRWLYDAGKGNADANWLRASVPRLHYCPLSFAGNGCSGWLPSWCLFTAIWWSDDPTRFFLRKHPIRFQVSDFRDERVAAGPLPVLAGRSRCGAGPAALAHGSWLPLPGQPAACCLPVPCRRQRQGLVQAAATATIRAQRHKEKPANRRGLFGRQIQ